MSFHLDFNHRLQHPHLAVYEAGKMLHFIQDGLNGLWQKLDFAGYGLQPVHKPCIISGALATEGGFS
jgi:hypothetical protein